MAYANLIDVEDALPAEEEMPVEPSNPENPSREYRNLVTALESATDLVIGYLKREYTGTDEDDDGVPDDVPAAVRRTVARVAVRAFLVDPSAPGAESEVNLMGPFSHTINWSKEAQARDFYLTDSDQDILDRFVTAYDGGAAHYAMYPVPNVQ